MRHALPADVVKVIEEQFAWTRSNWRERIQQRNESRFYAVSPMPGILRLIDRIPEELIVLDSSTDAQFTLALSALEAATTRGRSDPNGFVWPVIALPGRSEHEDCLMLVKDALAVCPNEAPSKSTKGLAFISDPQFRETLLIDLGSAERALNSDEWKACTVLSGSIIEALLLWAIKELHDEAERIAAVERAVANHKLRNRLQVKDLTAREWGLAPYIEIACELEEIKRHTANACREATYYRSLIHPAPAERDKTKCTRGKSHSALGAAYSTIEDLEAKHPK
jgi:hypothetical protein